MTPDLELESHSHPRIARPPVRSEVSENVWGYRKRLVFMERAIADFFPGREAQSVQVLDVGCGNGSQVAVPLARSGFQVMGVDPHLPSIEHARQLAKDLSNAEFLCGYARDLPPGRVFDVVILSEVLEHLDTPQLALQEGLAHLASHGIVLVTVPNGYGEFEIDSWLFRSLGLAKILELLKNSIRLRGIVRRLRRGGREEFLSTENQECGHVQFFTLSRLRSLFADLSLAVLREGAGSFLCGPMIHHTLAYSNRFVRWNARIADRLPLVLASGWYFALRPKACISDEAGLD
jgi:2-polyprenyl-3-methyl-5-hydroxy-6-metoxy-1,4-benzoquinol methylase